MLQARAFAKINLTLRVLGVRADGYHEIRTVFQTIALHDTLIVRRARGPFRLECDDPACPGDEANLVWRAADRVWRAAGRRGRPRDIVVRIRKRIPMEAGLGGGSSDAAAAIRVFDAVWHARLDPGQRHAIAAAIGADVPFLLDGGTALGVGRGDVLFPLPDLPPTPVVLVVPNFGVSTKQAYRWFDQRAGSRPSDWPQALVSLPVPASELINDLQQPVVAHHPEIAQLVHALSRVGATYAAMSGSGSAAFGLFATAGAASAAARALERRGWRAILTRTRGRRRAPTRGR